ncbi:GDSL family lipase [Nocardia terpenica]|uniref:GDSL-type esterase/lipase family protein n=1 Tax=Nocardia terpenica TaxID=455432 RepID=UPI001893EC6C|nr:GDSL-type esterase/lipase family protein [Nocardia terpenica]MBF6059342.1 GDSL family lipase [Nocardia terpenica]MBF6103119.1 GDSL family lipase [Nocardia terpenica]MBF6110692.1 GDSL family lipase [Nocardia terpenica]MBF6116823.1 GDSL family lipase [Nocardia terpenica]
MTITLRPGSTVMFTGDSITDARWLDEEHDGFVYPRLVESEWGFRHPDRVVNWLNSAIAGSKVTDLEARWQTDVLDTRPDVVSILAGVNDVGWHSIDPDGYPISAQEYAAGYDRLLAPLAESGAELILIEPFLLPVRGPIEVGGRYFGEDVRRKWRTDLDPKIQVVRELAREYGAHLLAADGMFAELSARTGPQYWAADGVHPTPAGQAALAAAWLRLVA